jgi:hypothetical protein
VKNRVTVQNETPPLTLKVASLERREENNMCLLSSETPPLTLKVASLERREENMWVSSLVDTPTALGMILAVFSFVIAITEVMGIWIYENKNKKVMARRRRNNILIFVVATYWCWVRRKWLYCLYIDAENLGVFKF